MQRVKMNFILIAVGSIVGGAAFGLIMARLIFVLGAVANNLSSQAGKVDEWVGVGQGFLVWTAIAAAFFAVVFSGFQAWFVLFAKVGATSFANIGGRSMLWLLAFMDGLFIGVAALSYTDLTASGMLAGTFAGIMPSVVAIAISQAIWPLTRLALKIDDSAEGRSVAKDLAIMRVASGIGVACTFALLVFK